MADDSGNSKGAIYFCLERSKLFRNAHILLTCVERFVAAAKVTGVLRQ